MSNAIEQYRESRDAVAVAREDALLEAVEVCRRIAAERHDPAVYKEQAIGANACAVAISGLMGSGKLESIEDARTVGREATGDMKETIRMRGIITEEQRAESPQTILCSECGQVAGFYTFERRITSGADGERIPVDGPRTPYCGEHFESFVRKDSAPRTV